MKNYFLIFLLASAVSCTEVVTETDPMTETGSTPPIRIVSMYDVPLMDEEMAIENPYEIIFHVEESEENKYNLVTKMKLNGGSFYVSPLSARDFSGRFTITLEDTTNLKIGNDFKETPRSIEEIDNHPFVNGRVNWVNADTRYDHQLTITSKEDFEVRGKYTFTIEPKCTLEEIPFIIKYQSGVLRIEIWEC